MGDAIIIGVGLSSAGGIKHACADEATVHRLMSATTARDDPHFSLHGRIFADDVLIFQVYTNQVGMGLGHAHKCFFDDILDVVDEFFHSISFPM